MVTVLTEAQIGSLVNICSGTIDTPSRQASIEEGVANGADAHWFDADAGTTEGVASILAFR